MKTRKPSSHPVHKVFESVCLDLAGSLILSAILLSFTSCGTKDEPAMVERPSEKMPNREVPAPGEEGSPANGLESDLGKSDLDSSDLKQSGCQSVVVAGSSGEHLCCTDEVRPPKSDVCETQWRKETGSSSCSLSFTNRKGVLWSCNGSSVAEESSVTSDGIRLKQSARSDKYKLHRVAQGLGEMAQPAYLKLQQHYVVSREPACNYFLITALCESGYCAKTMPWYRAAEFNEYFESHGWQALTLDQLKGWFIAGLAFDSVAQKDGVTASRPGHVVVPIGVGEKDRLWIAQASLGTVTNEVKSVSDEFILRWNGGFRIFAKADSQ